MRLLTTALVLCNVSMTEDYKETEPKFTGMTLAQFETLFPNEQSC